MNAKIAAYPNFIQSLGITAIVMSALYFSGQLFRVVSFLLGSTGTMVFAYVFGMGLSLWIILTLSRIQGDQKKFSYQIGSLKGLVLILIATVTLLIGIIYPISFLIPVSESTRAIFRASFSSVDFFVFMGVVIAAPILEEYIFRGILLDGLLKNYSPAFGIIFSSLLFGLFHANPLQLVSAFIGGIFLGWVFYKTKNILYCMLIHFMINLVGFLILFLYGFEKLLDLSFSDVYGSTTNATGIIVIASLIFGYTIYQFNLRKEKI